MEDTAVAVVRFRNDALGTILLSNSQKPGLFAKIHVHGANGASAGVQTDGGSPFISGVTTAIDPPLNDIWTVPGEEHLLVRWQAEDRARCDRINPMTYYHRLQIQDFLQAILQNRPPLVDGREGRKLVEIFTAVYRSQTRPPTGSVSAGLDTGLAAFRWTPVTLLLRGIKHGKSTSG